MPLIPVTSGRLVELGHEVAVVQGAGRAAGFDDSEYAAAGAVVVTEPTEADLVVVVTDESGAVGGSLASGTAILGLLDPLGQPERMASLAARGVTCLAFETLPRTTRAQSMDVLSSQATVLGYEAVVTAAGLLPKLFPMLTTAAGTIRPSKVLVLGAGVAGLQAIATARRLGGAVSAFDVRVSAAEQVESLGAGFVRLDLEAQDETASGGYARELSDDDQDMVVEALADHVADADVVIATAAIPGRPAPRLVSADAVARMRRGSVIVDAAAPTGGNCELTEPGRTITHDGVTIVGDTDLVARAATHASQMYSRNVFEVIGYIAPDGEIDIDLSDEIATGLVVAHGGAVRHAGVLAALQDGSGS